MPNALDLTGKNLRSTYQRVIQYSAGKLYDGLGNLVFDISSSAVSTYWRADGLSIFNTNNGSVKIKSNLIVGDDSPLEESANIQINHLSKGLLTSRLTEQQKNSIGNPATGLIVYQINNSEGLYIKKSNTWKKLLTSEDIISISPGAGLVGNNNTFSIVSASINRIVINEDSIDLAQIIVPQTSVGNNFTTPVISFDAYGRITAVSTATITPFSIGAQPYSDSLSSISSLSGYGGVLRKTSATTWTLDTSTYLVTETDPTVPNYIKDVSSGSNPSNFLAWNGLNYQPRYVSFVDLRNLPNTLSGYGIVNSYTKTEVDNLVTNNSTTENLNSSNLNTTVLTLINNYKPTSPKIFVNGLRLMLEADYIELGNKQIQFHFQPEPDSNIVIDYLKI